MMTASGFFFLVGFLVIIAEWSHSLGDKAVRYRTRKNEMWPEING